jgi:hypothetical protein
MRPSRSATARPGVSEVERSDELPPREAALRTMNYGSFIQSAERWDAARLQGMAKGRAGELCRPQPFAGQKAACRNAPSPTLALDSAAHDLSPSG